jgi:excinuclease ABC subunit B
VKPGGRGRVYPGMTETLQDRLRAAADVYSEHPPIFCLFFEAADALDHAATERRALQIAYNKEHGITPKTIIKKIHDITEELQSEQKKTVLQLLALDEARLKKEPRKLIKDKERQMYEAVKLLDFETAAILRDEIKELEALLVSKKEKPSARKKKA